MSRVGCKYGFALVVMVIFLSCNSGKMDFQEKSNLYNSISSDLAGPEYDKVYQSASDSIHNWIENGLDYESYSINNWKLDSLICFNQDLDRCVMAVLIRATAYSSSVTDGIHNWYGAKINGKWYFYRGPAIIIPRESYQKNVHSPLSFEKLHEIAINEVFRGYLTKDSKNKWTVNEKWFVGMEAKNFGDGYGSCFKCKTFEEYVLYLASRNWQEKAQND